MKRPQIVSNTELGIQKAIQWKIGRGSKKLKRDRTILDFTGVVGGEGEGTDHAAMKRHWRPTGGRPAAQDEEIERKLKHNRAIKSLMCHWHQKKANRPRRRMLLR